MEFSELLENYEKFLLGDLIAIVEKADTHTKENPVNQMAAPTAISIFSALDILGFLMRFQSPENVDLGEGFIEDINKRLRNEIGYSSANIAYSMLKWDNFQFGRFGEINVPEFKKQKQVCNIFRESSIAMFIDVFRNGIGHTFFQKKFIIDNSKKRDIYVKNELLFINANDEVVFNVRTFNDCFKVFFYKLQREYSYDSMLKSQIDENLILLISYLNDDKKNQVEIFKSLIKKHFTSQHKYYPLDVLPNVLNYDSSIAFESLSDLNTTISPLTIISKSPKVVK
ncbi:hypothetical protein V7S77_03160 [Aquirufa ecclesiirivi]